MRAALARSLAGGGHERALRAARGLYGLWYRTGDPREADRWGTLMLAAGGDVPDAWRAAAHMCSDLACDVLNRAPEGVGHADEAIRLLTSARDDRGLAIALMARGSLAMHLGDWPTATRCCRESPTQEEVRHEQAQQDSGTARFGRPGTGPGHPGSRRRRCPTLRGMGQR